tara:strand:+ start:956 stop:1126 length:171 start_codon:yes stop_codon:yes gene_type:complete
MCRRPYRLACFFEQPKFQGLLGNDFFQILGLTAQMLNLISRGSTCGIACQPLLAGL